MRPTEARPYRDSNWIVADPRLLGGGLAIRGTRLSVALILERQKEEKAMKIRTKIRAGGIRAGLQKVREAAN